MDEATRERFVPAVVETSVGMDRTALALLVNAYEEEQLEDGELRTVLHLHPVMAPIKVAVLPLSKKIGEPARKIAAALRRRWNVFYDESGNIGRRYRRQDEVGTPFCVTYDFESQTDDQVTVRERDSMNQERVSQDGLEAYIRKRLEE
jgi:glycyl-tRNA synthetase